MDDRRNGGGSGPGRRFGCRLVRAIDDDRALSVLIMKRLILIGALFLFGCNSNDCLVVVTVDADPPVTGIASLHVTTSVGSPGGAMTTREKDLASPISALPSKRPLTFGINVASGFGSDVVV